MKRFVFRAQAALDLRLKQEEEARRALAVAETRVRDARASLDAAQRLLDDIVERGRAGTESGDLTSSLWHRNWIIGQRQRIDHCRQHLEAQEVALTEAIARAHVARRKAKSLERFREHSWQRYTREEAHEAQKVLDELGGIRFVLGRQSTGGDM